MICVVAVPSTCRGLANPLMFGQTYLKLLGLEADEINEAQSREGRRG